MSGQWQTAWGHLGLFLQLTGLEPSAAPLLHRYLLMPLEKHDPLAPWQLLPVLGGRGRMEVT